MKVLRCSVIYFLLYLIPSVFLTSSAQVIADSSFFRNHIKLDLVPLYDVVFDARFQIRSGFEYERYLSEKSSASCYLDVGLYDKYNFIKYYDFFGQNQGLYSVRQKVSVAGFHLLPAYNYYFFTFKKKKNRRFFASGELDVSYYHKRLSSVNTSTAETYADKYNQMKLGTGIGMGFKNCFSKHYFYELKTSLFVKLYNYVSESDRNPIRSLDAQWTSPNTDFWWISNIKIGYAF